MQSLIIHRRNAMTNLETTLTGIDYKIRQLIEQNIQLREQVASLTERNEKQSETIETQNILINNLKEQIKVLKLGNTLTQKGDSTEIKLKINQLIRTIDKSLELLNQVK